MARACVYKWDVQAAPDRLRQQGKHPSIYAIRAELGNTGSKTTIHRYLQEIEAEEQLSKDGKINISEALLALIAPLAERLAADARNELEAAKATFEEEKQALTVAAEAARADTARSARQCCAAVSAAPEASEEWRTVSVSPRNRLGRHSLGTRSLRRASFERSWRSF